MNDPTMPMVVQKIKEQLRVSDFKEIEIRIDHANGQRFFAAKADNGNQMSVSEMDCLALVKAGVRPGLFG